jgi:hypothetical protein
MIVTSIKSLSFIAITIITPFLGPIIIVGQIHLPSSIIFSLISLS